REDVGPYLYNHWHFHPEVELTLIRKGTGMRLVGDSMEPFSDGDLMLLGSNLPHLWRSDPEYFQNKAGLQVEAVAIHFMDDFWGSSFLELPELKGIKELLEKSKRGIKVLGKTQHKISANMERMPKAKSADRLTLLLSMLNEIFLSGEYQLLSSIGFGKAYDRGHTDNINKIYNYTLEHFQEKICIRELAAIANVSPNSFCRYFKSRTMKTYWQFLLEVRIGYACKLLSENKISVSQICFSCGFNNLSNFNRQFKDKMGITPSGYLREHAEIIRAI
ncbi:MAG: AraC family transcriptional regulator, partial [Chitinophagaceae bacterium]